MILRFMKRRLNLGASHGHCDGYGNRASACGAGETPVLDVVPSYADKDMASSMRQLT